MAHSLWESITVIREIIARLVMSVLRCARVAIRATWGSATISSAFRPADDSPAELAASETSGRYQTMITRYHLTGRAGLDLLFMLIRTKAGALVGLFISVNRLC